MEKKNSVNSKLLTSMTKLAIIAMKKISSGQKNLHIAKGQLNSE